MCILESVRVSYPALSSELLPGQILGFDSFGSASAEFMWPPKKKKKGNNRREVQIWKLSTQRGSILVHFTALCSSAAFWSAVATNCHVVALPSGCTEAAVTGSGRRSSTVTIQFRSVNGDTAAGRTSTGAFCGMRHQHTHTHSHTVMELQDEWKK